MMRDDQLAGFEPIGAFEPIDAPSQRRRVRRSQAFEEIGIVRGDAWHSPRSRMLITRQAMPPADLEIVEIMRRRDLDRAACPSPDRNSRRRRSGCGGRPAAGRRACRPVPCSARHPDARRRAVSPSMVSGRVVATVMKLVAIVRIEVCGPRPDSGNARDGPWSRLCYDLEIGDRGEQLRVPVDQALVLVDQALPVAARRTPSSDGASTGPRPW